MALTCSYLIFVVVLAIGVAVGPDRAAAKAAMIGALAIFVAAYVAFWHTSITDHGWTCDFTWLRAGLAALICAISVVLALVHFEEFGYLFMFCSVVMAGLLPPRTGWIAVLGVGAATLLMIYAAHVPLIDWFWMPITATLGGLGVTFGRRMGKYDSDLRLAREEIARLAVSEERLRFARDLHDLLGHSLSVVVLKAELAQKLADAAPGRAVDEMADVERVAREALREVRDAVAGYRQPSLDQELESARGALGSAGVLARFEPVAGPMPAGLDATLAWALREGVTNIV
ncbi:MAG: sensor histidine kinase, partial [Candidatus Dormibacteraeota bacterium]|nr:sensor histidine kinase [Candidatus Dormibacteraeota bacterium]